MFSKLRVLFSFWLLMLLCPVFAGEDTSSAASHGQTVRAPKYVTVPVYYLTDRNIEGKGYGYRRRYPGRCQHDMYYGTTYVTIPNHKSQQPDPLGDKLGWKYSEDKPKVKDTDDRVNPAEPAAARREFFGRLDRALENAGNDELCIYIHGAASSFDDAALDAAELAFALHRPMVLYSWPSKPKLLDYGIDSGNCEWSQGHFNIFCRNLYAFKSRRPLHVIMLAHSMGNRFIFRAMHFLYDSQLISDCEFVSPDMDNDTCRHYVMGIRKINYNLAFRLYVSRKDRMLKLSQRIHGGYARLGEGSAPVSTNSLLEQITVRKENKKDEKTVLATMSPESKETGEENLGVLERIDFTAIDKGFTGHSIPCQLIADMVDGRKPAGIELVEEENDRSMRMRMARPVMESGGE